MTNAHPFSKPKSTSKESLLSKDADHSFEYDADAELLTPRTMGECSNNLHDTKDEAAPPPEKKDSLLSSATTWKLAKPLSYSITSFTSPPSYISTAITGGHRQPRYLPRGLRSRSSDETKWLQKMQVILNYTFTDPDLLEEALESPGSGIAAVGLSVRHCVDGNKGLAKVGQAVMKIVMRDLCYVLQVREGDMDKIEEQIIGRNSLDRVGRASKIEQFVRPMMRVPPTRRHNILHLLKDDARREDPIRTLERAMKAIIGAVYYDGGLEGARLVMGNLDLLIKLPK